MRTYGRKTNLDGSKTWIEVTTDANGYNDAVMITTLAQCLKLSINESPFYANYGINAQQSVMTQIFPDYYVQQTQQQFAPFFASLVISKVQGATSPTYNVNLVTQQGSRVAFPVPT
jgi:hypothetical protein